MAPTRSRRSTSTGIRGVGVLTLGFVAKSRDQVAEPYVLGWAAGTFHRS